jgi:ArsR family transcriptional regulator, arsenate/arsenite/antimonite-responsive transcriptional repressor
MKAKGSHDAVAKLSALAQETRLSLFRLLVEAGPAGLPAGEIAERLAVAAPTLSFHLKELSHAGLIGATPRGRFVVYHADFAAMNGLIAYLTENCCRMTCDAECAPAGAAESASRSSNRNTTRRRVQ